MGTKVQHNISFEEFELDQERRVLLRNGKQVEIYAKTFELLSFLVANEGRILTKDEILETVWEGQIVEEANLAVQISTLRKALEDDKNKPKFLVTVPGKGYKFVADLNGGTEITIEKQKLTRTVVEEELEISDDATDLANTDQNFKKIEQVPPSKIQNKILFPILLSGLLLIVGFGGFWIYRETSDASAIPNANGQMNITQITDDRIASCPSISPDGKFVAFTENYTTGSGSVFLHQVDTNTTVRLLEPGEKKFGCTNFSSDSSHLYYVEITKENPQGILFKIPVLGGTPKQIVNGLNPCFSISHDEKKVVFPRFDKKIDGNRLWIADIESGDEKVLEIPGVEDRKLSFWSAWSPDGKTIAFPLKLKTEEGKSVRKIYAIDLDTQKVKTLADEKFRNIGKMIWTSDGLSLVFVGAKPSENNEIYIMDVASGVSRRITNDLDNYGNYGLGITNDSSTIAANVFSVESRIWRVDSGGDSGKAERITNGQYDGGYGISAFGEDGIAYVARTSKGFEVYTQTGSENERKILTDDSSKKRDVIESPDGRYLVFASNQNGVYQIYRMNAEDTSDITQLTFGKNSNRRPDISPDGQWIVYHSFDGEKSVLRKVPLMGGESVQLTDYEATSPVFSPDGKTIACILPSRLIVKEGSLAVIPAEGGKPLKTFPVAKFSWESETIRWNPEGTAIIFHKKKSNLWKQPISGGEPTRLTNFKSEDIQNFAYSSDGKSILVARGNVSVDVVLIKNFR